jgi:hypothetical protein
MIEFWQVLKIIDTIVGIILIYLLLTRAVKEIDND